MPRPIALLTAVTLSLVYGAAYAQSSMKPKRAAKNDVARRGAKNARVQKAGGGSEHQDGRAFRNSSWIA